MNRKIAFILSAILLTITLTGAIDPPNVTLAKVAWGEARGESITQQAAVMWTVLNRVDDPRFPDTVYAVASQPSQFTAYSRSNPVDDDILKLADDVLERWYAEKDGWKDVGRVLPEGYCYFVSHNGLNAFSMYWPVRDFYDFNDLEVNPYDGIECVDDIAGSFYVDDDPVNDLVSGMPDRLDSGLPCAEESEGSEEKAERVVKTVLAPTDVPY